mmetsp:Transcript_2090/g.4482  ORF Transcript_2090/g.4482 Transcript_2090/m.4482 type:complete len:105 (-) Transcript_2090:911-1225(-)
MRMKNPNPNKSSLYGRLDPSSCSTPSLKKYSPFSRNESKINLAYIPILRRENLDLVRRFECSSIVRFVWDDLANQTDNNDVKAITRITNSHNLAVNGARTLEVW